jgi:hypothetical protein
MQGATTNNLRMSFSNFNFLTLISLWLILHYIVHFTWSFFYIFKLLQEAVTVNTITYSFKLIWQFSYLKLLTWTRHYTTEKRYSFISFFYIRRTDKYKVIFIDLGPAPMNIWIIHFDFDRPHMFIGDMDRWIYGGAVLTGMAHLYLETRCFLFLSFLRVAFHSPARFASRATTMPLCSLLTPPPPLC